MKIDFEMLDRMEAAGAPAKAIIAFLRTQFEREEAKRVVKRPKDAKRKRERLAATKGGNVATASDPERLRATLDDSPRARLFRECVPALIALNLSDQRARSLLASWLKMTNDDDQLVTAAVARASEQQVVDVPGYVMAILKEKTGNGHGTGNHRTNPGARESGTDAVLAGVAAAVQRRARERQSAGRDNGRASEDGHPAGEADPKLL